MSVHPYNVRLVRVRDVFHTSTCSINAESVPGIRGSRTPIRVHLYFYYFL